MERFKLEYLFPASRNFGTLRIAVTENRIIRSFTYDSLHTYVIMFSIITPLRAKAPLLELILRCGLLYFFYSTPRKQFNITSRSQC